MSGLEMPRQPHQSKGMALGLIHRHRYDVEGSLQTFRDVINTSFALGLAACLSWKPVTLKGHTVWCTHWAVGRRMHCLHENVQGRHLWPYCRAGYPPTGLQKSGVEVGHCICVDIGLPASFVMSGEKRGVSSEPDTKL